jgi:erythrocyte band 7 integral membrane protein
MLGTVCQGACLCLVCCSLGGCSCCASGVLYELPTATAGIVEEFGKFDRLLFPGLNVINPCTESVTEISMKVQCVRAGKQTVHTKDNITLEVETVVLYRIVNPLLVTYMLGVQSVHQNIREISVAVTRDTIGNSLLEEVLEDREKFSKTSLDIIHDLTRRQGILVEYIFLMDIAFSKETERNLISMAREQRVSEAKLIMSKAEVESASLMKETSRLLDSKGAMQIRYLELL